MFSMLARFIRSICSKEEEMFDFPSELKFLCDVDAFKKIIFLHTALSCNIFECLSEGSSTAPQIAKKLNLNEKALISILKALSDIGYTKKRGDKYAIAHFTKRFLIKGKDDYLGDYISLFIKTWGMWTRLEDVLKSGNPIAKMDLLRHKNDIILQFYITANVLIRHAAEELISRINISKINSVIVGEVGLTFLQALLCKNQKIAYTLAGLHIHKKFFPALLKKFPPKKAPEKFIYSKQGLASSDYWGKEGEYDIVFLYRKLAFYSYGGQYIKKARKLLRKGGLAIICEPTTDSFLHFVPWLLDGIEIMDMMIGGSNAPKLMSSMQIKKKLKKIGFSRVKVVHTVFGVFNFVIGIK